MTVSTRTCIYAFCYITKATDIFVDAISKAIEFMYRICLVLSQNFENFEQEQEKNFEFSKVCFYKRFPFVEIILKPISA